MIDPKEIEAKIEDLKYTNKWLTINYTKDIKVAEVKYNTKRDALNDQIFYLETLIK